jgi:vacuolar-type H+-ATPase subunit I/STV1
MEILELFAKAIAPQLLTRIFDNIPQYAIFIGFISIFLVKYFLRWNKTRVEKIKAKELADEEKAKIKEERSQATFKNTENLISKVDIIEKAQKETAEEIKVLRTETAEEIKVLRTDYNALHTRVAVIETENRINSKQEGAIMTMLNRIFNSIEKK